jgi:hypothetical protein
MHDQVAVLPLNNRKAFRGIFVNQWTGKAERTRHTACWQQQPQYLRCSYQQFHVKTAVSKYPNARIDNMAANNCQLVLRPCYTRFPVSKSTTQTSRATYL